MSEAKYQERSKSKVELDLQILTQEEILSVVVLGIFQILTADTQKSTNDPVHK